MCKHWKWPAGWIVPLVGLTVALLNTEGASVIVSFIPVMVAGLLCCALLVCTSIHVARSIEEWRAKRRERLAAIAMELKRYAKTFDVWVTDLERQAALNATQHSDQADCLAMYEKINRRALIRRYSDNYRDRLLGLLSEARRHHLKDVDLVSAVEGVSTTADLQELAKRIQGFGFRIQRLLFGK